MQLVLLFDIVQISFCLCQSRK